MTSRNSMAGVVRFDTLSEMVDDCIMGKAVELLSQLVCWHCFMRTRSRLSFLTHEQVVHTNLSRATVTGPLHCAMSLW